MFEYWFVFKKSSVYALAYHKFTAKVGRFPDRFVWILISFIFFCSIYELSLSQIHHNTTVGQFPDRVTAKVGQFPDLFLWYTDLKQTILKSGSFCFVSGGVHKSIRAPFQYPALAGIEGWCELYLKHFLHKMLQTNMKTVHRQRCKRIILTNERK